MERFYEGQIVFHKATLQRCVVLNKKEGLIVVRTEKEEERDYYPQELKTEEEYEKENNSFTSDLPEDYGENY